MAYEIPDNEMHSQISKGRAWRQEQMSGAPRFGYDRTSLAPSKSDIVLQALLGLNSGSKAALESASLGDPLVSFLAGSAGAATAPNVQDIRRQQRTAQMQEQASEMELLPIEQISPGLVERHPELKGVPAGLVNKIAPILSRSNSLEQQIAMMGIRAENTKENIKLAGQVRADADTIDANRAAAFSRATGIPAEFFEGQRKADVNSQLQSFRPAQRQAEAMLQTRHLISELKSRWNGISGDVGIAEGTARGLANAATGGNANPKMAAYEDARQSAITAIRGLFADVGAPSNFDVERLLKSIPGTKSGKSKGKENWAILETIQKGGEASLRTANPMAGFIIDRKPASSGAAGMSDNDILAELNR